MEKNSISNFLFDQSFHASDQKIDALPNTYIYIFICLPNRCILKCENLKKWFKQWKEV
jgi:hypothetical protein